MATEWIFFSRSRGTFSRIGHLLGHKANFNTSQKTEIVQNMLPVHNLMKLDIKNREKNWEIQRCVEIKQHTLNDRWVKGGVRKQVRKSFQTNENEATHSKPTGRSRSNALRRLCSYKRPLLKKHRSQMNNPNFHPNVLEKEHTKPKASRRQEIMNIMAEINELDDIKR